jgi:hypothetical protein
VIVTKDGTHTYTWRKYSLFIRVTNLGITNPTPLKIISPSRFLRKKDYTKIGL